MFLRKLIIGSAAVAALGASTAVLADNYAAVPGAKDTGFYVTGAAGYSWAGSDNSSTLSVLEGGSSNPLNPTIRIDSQNGGVAGRVAAGYSLNKYFGLETGFNLYSPAYRQIDSIYAGDTEINVSSESDRVKTSLYSADLLGKITLPIGSRFFAFVNGGGAYVHAKTQAVTLNYNTSFFGANGTTAETVWSKSSTKNYFRPEAGAGVGVNVTNSLAVDVSYSRLFGTGSITSQNYLASINTGLVGLTYKF